jgi:rhamnosyltransferase
LKVCAGIVAYNPDVPDLFQLVKRLENEVERTVVIDNASFNQAHIVDRLRGAKSVSFILNEENLGMAAAINQLIRYAAENRYDLLLPFDQDSMPEPGICRKLQAAFEGRGEGPGRVAAAGPLRIDARTGRPEPFVRFAFPFNRKLRGGWDPIPVAGAKRPAVCGKTEGGLPLETDFLISSGCLISLDAVRRIGAMDESLFIDNVDLEWSFRARRKGYRLMGVPSAVMWHRIGDRVTHLPRLNLSIRWHSPPRTYYMVRNRLWLYQRGYVPLSWKIHDAARFLFKLFLLFFTGTASKDHFRYFARGCRDAIRSRQKK